MSYNSKTNKYDLYITPPTHGIKGPQKVLIASFDTEIEARAGNIVAEKMMELPPQIPSNEAINAWLAHQLRSPQKNNKSNSYSSLT